MNKDKLTDRRDNNIENKKEDYTDGNGNPEEFIEDMTDPEATAIFKEAFYAEGKALEEEALRSSFVEDEEEKETLRLRILASAGRSEDEAAVECAARESDVVAAENADLATQTVAAQRFEAETTAVENAKLEDETVAAQRFEMVAETTAVENVNLEAKAMAGENVQRRDKARFAVVNGTETLERKKKRRFTPLVRWAAVIILVCVGVFSVSMTGQAKGSGLWGSIQWLIGGETRWENENNGENRTYTNPEEEKAIGEIEEKLGIIVPKFFYWPDHLVFQNVYIFEEPNSFILEYSDGQCDVYFEGWEGGSDASSNNVWQGEGEETRIEYSNTTYILTEVESEGIGNCYYVRWTNQETKFVLSGIKDLEETKKILENIKKY